MGDEHLRVTYSSSVERLCEINSSFDSGILKVAYTGKNRNGSSISKETFEKCMSTIYNCPIVCNYNRERDEIGSHDFDVVVKDGIPTMVNITQPVGVVPESAKIWWQEFEDATGVHEYLCTEVLIWKRQEAYQKIKENVITDESMEIRVKSGYMEDGVYVIESFEFLAFCLLESAPPCYESAGLEMFNLTDFQHKYAEMMEEFKQNFQQVGTSVEVDIQSTESLTEGGEKHLEQKMELLAKFGLTKEQLDFNIEDISIEEMEQKLKKLADDDEAAPAGDESTPDPVTDDGGEPAESTEEDEEDEDEGEPEEPEDENFSLTGEQLRDELMEALYTVKVETVWGESSRYIYCDYDTESSEVYCYDVMDWKLYGFSYSMNGDVVIIDFESKKRKKFSIVDFDNGDIDKSYAATFEAVIEMSASQPDTNEFEQKYNDASNTINEMNIELTELRQYKQQKLSEERAADEDAVFSMFADLNGNENFEALRKDCSHLSIDEIEDKCFAIRGRINTQTFSAVKPGNTRLPIERNKAEGEPYGGLFVEFPPNR